MNENISNSKFVQQELYRWIRQILTQSLEPKYATLLVSLMFLLVEQCSDVPLDELSKNILASDIVLGKKDEVMQ